MVANTGRKNEDGKKLSDGQVIRRQVLILIAIFGLGGLVYGVFRVGSETGWGNQDKAVEHKLKVANDAIVARDLDKAILYFRRVVEKYPGHSSVTQVLTQLANTYREKGELDTAIRTYQKLLEMIGNNPEKKDLQAFTLLEMAKIYQDSGQFQEALKNFEKVRTEHPKTDWSGEALAGIGRVHQHQQEYRNAIASFEAVIKELPGGFLAAEAQSAIGACLESMGQTRNAIRAYQKVLDEYPSAVWDQAKARIELLESRLATQTKQKTKK